MNQQSLPSKTVFDIQGTLTRLGGDEQLLSDMIGFFVKDGPNLMADLRTAIEAHDSSAAKNAAHELKGLILGCGGVRAAQVAQRVEDAATAGDVDDATRLVVALTREVAILVEATIAYRT